MLRFFRRGIAMPELPEVETMVRGLRPALQGRFVDRIEVHDPFLIQGCEAQEFERRGRKVEGAGGVRRGKGGGVSVLGRRGIISIHPGMTWGVVISLSGRRGIIIIQPRMTGGFWLVDPHRPEHIRLSFRLAKPAAMVWYCDARRLGKIHWFDGPEEAAAAFARSHGPDALEIGRDELAARLKKTTRGIKPALMDQKVLAGIGNIYADEILFAARIHPERTACKLS